jgi:hypothetical protein
VHPAGSVEFREVREPTLRIENSMFALLQLHRRPLLPAAFAVAALVVAGCASTPPPTQSLQAATQAITTAETAEAPRYAAGELASSRSKLLAAGNAVTAKDMVKADRLAQESRVEAEYAAAKSVSAKAKMVNDEMRSSTSSLVEEMNRNTGDKR